MMRKQILWTVAMMASTTMMAQKFQYPIAPRDNSVDTYFGEQVSDPFRPLEDDNSEATKAWVKAENRLTQEYLQKIPFRSKILKRLKELAN